MKVGDVFRDIRFAPLMVVGVVTKADPDTYYREGVVIKCFPYTGDDVQLNSFDVNYCFNENEAGIVAMRDVVEIPANIPVPQPVTDDDIPF